MNNPETLNVTETPNDDGMIKMGGSSDTFTVTGDTTIATAAVAPEPVTATLSADEAAVVLNRLMNPLQILPAADRRVLLSAVNKMTRAALSG